MCAWTEETCARSSPRQAKAAQGKPTEGIMIGNQDNITHILLYYITRSSILAAGTLFHYPIRLAAHSAASPVNGEQLHSGSAIPAGRGSLARHLTFSPTGHTESWLVAPPLGGEFS